jgi:hypothetical protein
MLKKRGFAVSQSPRPAYLFYRGLALACALSAAFWIVFHHSF